MEEEYLFGNLDTTDPDEIAKMEKLLFEKYERRKEEREKKETSDKKAV